jgi:hypothetical protein
MKQYRALVGLNYIPVGGKEEKRVEIGGDCSDVPPQEIKVLLANIPPSIEEYQSEEKADDKATKPNHSKERS